MRLIFPITDPIGGNVSRIADREQMKIRRVTEIIDNFKRGRLLASNAIRVNRVHNGKFLLVTELAHNSERIIEVSVNRHNLSAVRERLNEFSSGDFSGRQHDRTWDVSAGGVGRR